MTAAFALDTSDLDQARDLVGRTIAPFGLTPCRPSGYRARIRAGRVGALGLAEVSYRAAIDIRSRAPHDTLILEIPLSGHCRVERGENRRGGDHRRDRDHDRDLRRGDVRVAMPGRAVNTWMGDGSQLLVVRIPASVLDPSGEWDRERFEPRRWAPVSSLRADRLASLERLARLVFEDTVADGAVSSEAALGAELQQVMLALLGRARDWDPLGTVGAEGLVLPRSVRRAQALMIAAPAGGLPLPVLARSCGVSIRTLQDNFRQFTGLSPSEWWRNYRLDRVQAALRAARPETGVTQAATAYGFFHLGRFAEQYRARFGEPPSETLRRARWEDG